MISDSSPNDFFLWNAVEKSVYSYNLHTAEDLKRQYRIHTKCGPCCTEQSSGNESSKNNLPKFVEKEGENFQIDALARSQ